MKLNEIQRALILNRIESLFENAKVRLLGRLFKGPSLYFEAVRTADPLQTIEGIYIYTLNMLYGAGIKPNEKTIEQLSEITGNYIDSQQLKVKNHILADIARAKTPSEAIQYVKQHFEKTGKYIDLLITNETRIAQVYASREGITKLSSDIGVADPTVVFLGVTDHKICKYCKSMYHDSANLRKPKPYRLSQVNEGYFKPKDWDGKTPYQSPVHPRCRHTMAFVPPNFGYNDNGTIEFKGFGYDYYKDYWKMKKVEDYPDNLIKTESNFISYDEYLEFSLDHELSHTCHKDCKHDDPNL